MNIFNNLVASYTDGLTNTVGSFTYKYRPPQPIHYYAPTPFHNSVLLERVRFETMKALDKELQNMYHQAMNRLRGTQDTLVSTQLKSRKEWLIQNSQMKPRLKEQEYGVIRLTDSDGKVGSESAYATDAWGRIVRESLMLYYDEEEPRKVTVNTYKINSGKNEAETYDTRTMWFADVTPQVSLSSGNNVVLTKVTGRDFSRKEIIAGDDLTFNVSGEIASHNMPTSDDDGETYIQYPEDEVRKFIQIMQHTGIIKVNHFLFSQCNVDRIIIKDWSLDHPTYKNIQPYRFTCVAVEPDEDVMVGEDTIQQLDETIRTNSGDGVLDVLMKHKLGKATVEKLDSAASGSITSLLALGLDSIPL